MRTFGTKDLHRAPTLSPLRPLRRSSLGYVGRAAGEAEEIPLTVMGFNVFVLGFRFSRIEKLYQGHLRGFGPIQGVQAIVEREEIENQRVPV